ncbi:uncharacterized protein LOC107367444 [Tetranychus urticae]|uniref:Uncharacterized protein n=1 Tax=Tetranychus urticae TaxID=32264 RepID=T1KUR1_TETUR|nr:uncharacterized protein LOC107367444 [Tetranychus urticae]
MDKMFKLLSVTLISSVILCLTHGTLCASIKSPSNSLSASLGNSLRSNPIKDARDLTWMLVQEYSRFLLSLFESAQSLEKDIKRRTYIYGLDVVGRPIDQLTPIEMLLSAALRPRNFYHKATDNFSRKLSKVQKTIDFGMDAVDKARKTSSILYTILQSIPRSG